MSDPKINICDILLIYSCSSCGKINSLDGDKLSADIYPSFNYGPDHIDKIYTGETLLLLICQECGEASYLNI